ncbi:RidA family protein [Pseudaestuariivita sp.]|uniref:RidA family protein n=1 Tax=Pseudaestuariivita sp. TaxID=2211669 RepID=UPI0040588BF3
MTITRHHGTGRMSRIVEHNDTVYLCGQVGTRGDSVTRQTEETLAKVEALLAEAGSDKDHILQAIIWLSDMAHFAEMNAVWDAWVTDGCEPARACGEAKLASPELFVEIIVTAAKRGS